MAGVFVFSERPDLAAELVSFAHETGQICTVIAVRETAMEECKAFGAEQIICLRGQSERVEGYGKAIAALLAEREFALFVVGATQSGRELAAYVATVLDCGMIGDVSSATLEGDRLVAERMLYGGALTRKEALRGRGVITVPAGAREKASGAAGEIIFLDVADDDRVKLESVSPIVREGADLSIAEKVVCVGMGFEKKEDLRIAYDLAAALGGEVGGTRAIAEDHHWLPDYIGLSGVKIKPRLYIGLAVSGQIQHSVGVKDSQVVVAINKDSKAPIFSDCDYGIVGDVFEIAPLLTAALK